MGWFDPQKSGFDTQDDSESPDAIRMRQALAQMLLQRGQEPTDYRNPYSGLANAGNQLLGAYLLKKSMGEDKANYAAQVGSEIGSYAPLTSDLKVTPKMAPGEAPRPASTYANMGGGGEWQQGPVATTAGLTPEKARALYEVLHNRGPEGGRKLLDAIEMKQFEAPPPLEWHSPEQNAYNQAGQIVVHGTPAQAYKPGQIVTIESGGQDQSYMVAADGVTKIPIGKPTPHFKPDKPDKGEKPNLADRTGPF